MVRIELDNATVRFRVRQQRRIAMKEYLLRCISLRRPNSSREIYALKDLNMSFEEGERVGVIGPNGAGKSTFLKLVCGIYPPTAGKINVQGHITNLLDIGLGIESESTGWDNIAYRSYLQGATRQELNEKKEEIAEFSGLGDFLNMPVRFYSSGMTVRLCFAVATHIDPEILLLDEMLSAGDAEFQVKAKARMMDLIEKTRLLIFASHDLTTLRTLCNRILWLSSGDVIMDGPPDEVIPCYKESAETGARLAA